MKLKLGLWTILILLVFTSLGIQAKKKKKQYFSQIEFEVDFTVTHPIYAKNFIEDSNQEILIFGVNEKKEKIAALYVFNNEQSNFILHSKQIIPSNIAAFDFLTNAKGLANLLFLDSKGLSLLNLEKQKIIPLMAAASIYLKDSPQFIARKQLVKDLNNDGLDDIVIPNFSNTSLFLQTRDGEFIENRLPIKPRTDMNEREVSFSENHFLYQDINFDQRTDLILVEENKLVIYEQLESGEFSLIANEQQLPMQVSGVPWWFVRTADGKQIDQSQLKHRMIEDLIDINGDDIVDLMVRQTESSGVLDKSIHYDIYFGSNQEGILNFNAKADTQIVAEGTLANLQLLDMNDDGKKEVLVSSFDIGVSQIIGALLSGSIDQDVFVFSLNQDNHYDKKPLFSEEVDLKFSLSSGSTGQPVLLSADLNGDGLKELILSASEKKLAIYKGSASKQLFESRPKWQRVTLPQNGAMLSAADLNGDKKEEIIIRYGKQDEPGLRRQIIILSTK